MQESREKLKSDIIDFIDRYVNDDDVVVGVLRYGSHIPHVYQKTCLERGKQPKDIRLVLSHMLSFFPPEFFPDRSFLILDDTVYEGVVMGEKLSQIHSLGAAVDRVRSAVLVAHELSDFEVDCPKPLVRLPDSEYIAWKEELAFVVRQDIRPTERDHPLYYFRGENLELGQLLSIIENYGKLHPVGSDWNAPVFRASLTIDSSILSDVAALDGIELDKIAKIRLYWQNVESGYQITLAPIVFAAVEIPTFVEKSCKHFSRLLGLADTFFSSMYESRPPEMVFYFVTRCIAALLLHRFLLQIGPRLRLSDRNLSMIPPEVVDGHVNYLFPDEYVAFYRVVTDQIKKILSTTAETSMLPLGDSWKLPECNLIEREPGRLLPDVYRILEFMTRQGDPALWDGKRWLPRKTAKGVSFREMVGEFGDVCFVSAALDELLDCGLIRARDYQRSQSSGNYMVREFLSGGEYKALQVSRIADTWRFEPPAVDPTLREAEAVDLWGSD